MLERDLPREGLSPDYIHPSPRPSLELDPRPLGPAMISPRINGASSGPLYDRGIELERPGDSGALAEIPSALEASEAAVGNQDHLDERPKIDHGNSDGQALEETAEPEGDTQTAFESFGHHLPPDGSEKGLTGAGLRNLSEELGIELRRGDLYDAYRYHWDQQQPSGLLGDFKKHEPFRLDPYNNLTAKQQEVLLRSWVAGGRLQILEEHAGPVWGMTNTGGPADAHDKRSDQPDYAAESIKEPGQQQPPQSLSEIIASLSPDAEVDWQAVRRLAREHWSEVIDGLRQHDAIPQPQEISDLRDVHGNEPIRLTRPVTVGDMTAHLRRVDNNTPEIGLTVFGDQYILHLGEEHAVTPPMEWQTVEEAATASIHTHPSEEHPENYYPSIGDIKNAQYTNVPNVVMSRQGVILLPSETEFRTLPTWMEHGLTAFEFDREYSAEEIVSIKNDYLRDALGVQVIPWDDLPDTLTVQEAVDYAVRLRAQRLSE